MGNEFIIGWADALSLHGLTVRSKHQCIVIRRGNTQAVDGLSFALHIASAEDARLLCGTLPIGIACTGTRPDCSLVGLRLNWRVGIHTGEPVSVVP